MKYFREIDAGMDALMDRKTEEIRLSEEIKPMEQKKDEMVMYLAHDIRTPLTSVIGYLKLMQEMPDLTEEQREKFLGIIMEKALRLEVLVNEFFDIARYSRQDISAEEEEIDLCYMISDCGTGLHGPASARCDRGAGCGTGGRSGVYRRTGRRKNIGGGIC